MPIAAFVPGEAERQRDTGLWRIDPKSIYWVEPCVSLKVPPR
jgi:hypothetical protein